MIGKKTTVSGRFTGCALLLGVLACESKPTERPKPEAAPLASEQTKVRRPAPLAEPRVPEPLLELPESAYGARLSFHEGDLFLVTPQRVHRFGKDGAAWSREEEFGHHAFVAGDRIVHWSKGAFWARPLRSSAPPRLIAKTRAEPSLCGGSGDALAWVEPDPRGGAALNVPSLGKARTVYRTTRTLTTLLVHGDHAFFVERDAAFAWRIGRVSLTTSSSAFTETAETRPPSMLAASPDALFYYGGLEGGVRELSFDFASERVVKTRFICSPIAAAREIFCASVPGISALPRTGGEPSLLMPAKHGPITNLTADEESIAWVTDAGPDRLAVRRLKLPKQ